MASLVGVGLVSTDARAEKRRKPASLSGEGVFYGPSHRVVATGTGKPSILCTRATTAPALLSGPSNDR